MPQVGDPRPFTITFGGEHGVGIRRADVGIISALGATEVYIRVGLGTALGWPFTAMALAYAAAFRGGRLNK